MCPLILTDGLGQLRFTRSIPTAPSFLYLFLYSVIAFFVYIYCCNVCPLIGFLCILCPPPPSLVSISLAYPLDPRVTSAAWFSITIFLPILYICPFLLLLSSFPTFILFNFYIPHLCLLLISPPLPFLLYNVLSSFGSTGFVILLFGIFSVSLG